MFREVKKTFRKLSLLLAIVTAAFLLWGCGGGGSDGYNAPEATQTTPISGQTQSVLIDEATLQDWIDSGLVNDENSYEKVVILDVTEAARYGNGHIPGAQLWDMAENYQERIEGPALSVQMVLDGASMDAMLQKHGIDEGTTIVITSSYPNTHKVLRAYFQFRYWGFPKERLKVLNGFNGVWPSAELTTVVPAVTPSTFSVRDLGALCPDVRMSLSEMIAAVKSGSHLPVDFRGAGPFDTPGVFSDVAGDYVVFEGYYAGGTGYSFKNFNIDYAAGSAAAGVDSDGFKFKDAATIAAELEAAGIDNSKPIITACRTGNIASAAFFVLDGILGWDAAVYDGSWSQWGQMSTDTTKGGELAAGSLWATDNPELSSSIVYNIDVPRVVEVLPVNAQAQALYPDPSLPEANPIENEDAAYMSSGGSDDSGAATSSSGGSGGGC